MSVFLQPIYTQTIGSGGANSITFNSIPQTFTDLLLVSSPRGSSAVGEIDLFLRFNGDGTNSYSGTRLYGNGSTVGSDRQSNVDVIRAGTFSSTSGTANTFSNSETYIPNYSGGNYKQVLPNSVSENNATTNYYSFLYGMLWNKTNAITSIGVFCGTGLFAQYSTFTLYGITKG